MIPSIKEITQLDITSEMDAWKGPLERFLTKNITEQKKANKVYNEVANLVMSRDEGDIKTIGELRKSISNVLNKHSVSNLIKGIMDIVGEETDWRTSLEKILKRDGLSNLEGHITQSILEHGTHLNQNDFLYYLNRLPKGILEDLKPSTLSLVQSLIDQDRVDVYYDDWLTDEDLYIYNSFGDKNAKDLDYVIKAILFLSNPSNLRGYGDPEHAPKLLDDDGRLAKDENGRPLTAAKIKDLLSEWQEDTTDHTKKAGRSRTTTGYDILTQHLKKNTLTMNDTIEYIKRIDSLRDTKNYSVDFLKQLVGDDIKKVLSKKYMDTSIRNLNQDFTDIVLRAINSIRSSRW